MATTGSRRPPRARAGRRRDARTARRNLGALVLITLVALVALPAVPAAARRPAAAHGPAAARGDAAAPAQDGAAAARAARVRQEAPVVRMARATWDTGWFQHEVAKLLLQRLGYRVEGPVTMENEEFFQAVAAGDVDLWVDGWFPLHQPLLDANPGAEAVGNLVEGGALQGYLVDAATAAEHDITNLGDLADPDVAGLFDADGDGKADLIGCDPGWACAEIIDHHLQEYGLTGTVEHVQGDYSPLMGDTVDRHEAGEPVLFYTFTPNWTVGLLEPGSDVVWLETPFPSLPGDQAGTGRRAAVDGLAGCAADPCQVGWPPSDIRAVANSAFLDANPAVRALLEQVEIPLEDILEQNARMVDGEGDRADIRRHAEGWVAANAGTVGDWVAAADPDATPVTGGAGAGGGGGGAGDDGVLRVAVRTLPPFVLYENRTYGGFSVELIELIAARLGMDAEIYAVDTAAKQTDDVYRGAADVALGGLAITSARAGDIDLSQPTFRSGLQIMVRAEQESSLGAVLARVTSGALLSGVVWFILLFGLILLVTGHAIWLLERRRNPAFPESYPRGIAESIWWSVVAITPFGAGDNTPSRATGRVFAVLWIITGYFLLAYFTASVTTTMAVGEIRGDIAGPGDLRDKRVGALAESPGADYLVSAGVGPVLFDDLDATLEALEAGEVDAVVGDAAVLRFQASRHGGENLTVVGPVFNDFSYGVGLPPDGELRRELDIALLELIEDGVYDTLHQRWFGASAG